MKTVNAMPELPPDYSLYEYCTLRYVPRIERGEFVNVGLLMMCKRRRWLKCRVHLDEARISSLGGTLGVETLRRQLAMFENRDILGRDVPVEEVYRWLCAPKNAVLQTSPSHPGIAADGDLEATFAALFTLLVL